MTRRGVALCVLAGAVLMGPYVAPAALAQTADEGQVTFETYCSSCHGTSGTGDGPLAKSLKTRPADLTQIAKRNGGTFAADQVTQFIDGRKWVKDHGARDMPVWGDVFPKSRDNVPSDEKIRLLVAYLESIQVKP